MASSVCSPTNPIPSIFCNMYLSDWFCNKTQIDSVTWTKPRSNSTISELNPTPPTWFRALDHWKTNISTKNPEQFSMSQVSEKKKVYVDDIIGKRTSQENYKSLKSRKIRRCILMSLIIIAALAYICIAIISTEKMKRFKIRIYTFLI